MANTTENIINNLQKIPKCDKEYLVESLGCSRNHLEIYKNLSIFSKKVTFEVVNEYTYVKTNENCDIFYIPYINTFIDEDKKIICFSTIKVDLGVWFYDGIDHILNVVEGTDITDNRDIGENFICCQKWFVSYGHFTDEIFTMFDFMEKLKELNDKIINFKHIQDYPVDQTLMPGYLVANGGENYNKMANYLFGNTFMNLNNAGSNCYKLKNLLLIKHNFSDPTFHKCPKSARDHIISQVRPIETELNKNIFITRTEGKHMARNIGNLNEINEFFNNNNYDVINPENMDYDLFIHYLKNAEKVFLTWGGIMVSMAYMNPNAKIYILKSKPYEGERLDVIGNMIHHYSLENKINVINHVDNLIDLTELEKLLHP
jgi:hypothetical protein